MDNSIKVQIYVFLSVFYGGLIIGFIYDIYRAFRYYLKPKKVATILEDFIFWIVVVIITFYMLIKSNFGEIRGYVFVGIFLGVYIYLKVLSKLIYPLLIKILKVLYVFFNKIFHVVLYPLSLIKKLLMPHINKVKKVNSVSKETVKNMNKYINIISKKK